MRSGKSSHAAAADRADEIAEIKAVIESRVRLNQIGVTRLKGGRPRMSIDLFGIAIPDGPAMTPAERRKLPKPRKDPIPKGYAAPPGTGPMGETCGSCLHHAIVQHANRYHKCGLMRQIWTGGGATDIRVRSPACSLWERL